MKCYTIRKSRLARAFMVGMSAADDGTVRMTAGQRHYICLPPLYGRKQEEWGRLNIETELPRGSRLLIYAAVSEEKEVPKHILLNDTTAYAKRASFFAEHGKGPLEMKKNLLLYGLKGRYLWLMIEVADTGLQKDGRIDRIRVFCPGDDFMNAFPQIYQEKGGVFHRFISVFSTVCSDFKEQAELLRDRVDLVRAGPEELTRIAGWFGIDLGDGLLTISQMREITANLHCYVKMKGTRFVMRELTRMLAGETPLIIESSSKEIVLLLERKLTEDEELKLLFFLLQFKPIHIRLNVLFYQEEESLDSYCFTDGNAALACPDRAALDRDCSTDTCVIG